MKFSSNPTGVSVYAGKYYNSTIVEIPASNNNKQVTEIADNAFSDKNNIKKVVLPSTITKIGNNAFSGATALETINIPDDVACIGNYAFKGCKSLRTITIPEKTTKIGSEAFSGCENLAEIIIVAREGGIEGFAEDWKKGIPSSTVIKRGFVINLEYNGATSDDSIKKAVISLNDDYQLPVPKKKGYSFLGWFDSSDGGRKLTDENGLSLEKYSEEKSITVYARWKANLNVVMLPRLLVRDITLWNGMPIAILVIFIISAQCPPKT